MAVALGTYWPDFQAATACDFAPVQAILDALFERAAAVGERRILADDPFASFGTHFGVFDEDTGKWVCYVKGFGYDERAVPAFFGRGQSLNRSLLCSISDSIARLAREAYLDLEASAHPSWRWDAFRGMGDSTLDFGDTLTPPFLPACTELDPAALEDYRAWLAACADALARMRYVAPAAWGSLRTVDVDTDGTRTVSTARGDIDGPDYFLYVRDGARQVRSTSHGDFYFSNAAPLPARALLVPRGFAAWREAFTWDPAASPYPLRLLNEELHDGAWMLVQDELEVSDGGDPLNPMEDRTYTARSVVLRSGEAVLEGGLNAVYSDTTETRTGVPGVAPYYWEYSRDSPDLFGAFPDGFGRALDVGLVPAHGCLSGVSPFPDDPVPDDDTVSGNPCFIQLQLDLIPVLDFNASFHFNAATPQ